MWDRQSPGGICHVASADQRVITGWMSMKRRKASFFDLISLVGASTGVIVGVGFVVGAITAATAGAALAVVGEVLAVVAAIVIIFGVIEGAIERSVRLISFSSSLSITHWLTQGAETSRRYQ